MPQITPDDIHNIHDFNTLLDFLRDKLQWPIPEDVALEDIAFPRCMLDKKCVLC